MKRTSKYGYGRNAYKKPEDRVVGWGKYSGAKMSEVPTDYLQWFVKNAYGHMTARKEYAQQELERRANENNNRS
jgi:hypothetical protein